MQSRLRSLTRLSYALSFLDTDLKSLPTFGPPLPTAIRRSDLSGRVVDVRLQGMTTLSPTSDPFEFPSAVRSRSQLGNDSDETPPVTSDVEGMKERFTVGRDRNEVTGCVYYQLDLSLSSGNDQQSLFALLEIPPNYPLRTPQVLLTPRTASSAPSTHSYAYLSTLRSIEQEVNAGCLLFFENSANSENIISKSELLEEALDSVLSLQISTLVSLLSSGATFDEPVVTTGGNTVAFAGKNRNGSKSGGLTKLYGRNYLGL
jgi:hypothetical protein